MPPTEMPVKVIEIIETNYVMFYRHGMSPINFKGFKFKGDFKAAQQRAYQHGKVMGYKNIWVTPLICDLDEEEQKYNGKSDQEIVTQKS